MNLNEREVAEALESVMLPLFRGAIHAAAAHICRAGRAVARARLALREGPGDREAADEVSRARARQILDRHGRRAG